MTTNLKTINAGGPIPKQHWEDLKAKTLAAIKEIDDATPHSDREPQWWLEMSNVRRALLIQPGERLVIE